MISISVKYVSTIILHTMLYSLDAPCEHDHAVVDVNAIITILLQIIREEYYHYAIKPGEM